MMNETILVLRMCCFINIAQPEEPKVISYAKRPCVDGVLMTDHRHAHEAYA